MELKCHSTYHSLDGLEGLGFGLHALLMGIPDLPQNILPLSWGLPPALALRSRLGLRLTRPPNRVVLGISLTPRLISLTLLGLLSPPLLTALLSFGGPLCVCICILGRARHIAPRGLCSHVYIFSLILTRG